MSEVDPTPDDARAAVAALRATSARVAELDTPDDATSDGDTGPGLDPDFDVAEHAARFEELHDALSSVLATLDRT